MSSLHDKINHKALSDDYFPDDMIDKLDDNEEDDDFKANGIEENIMYLDQLGGPDA